MEFPELLSVLLYEDCYSQAVAEEPRLRALATANGTNAALQIYLNYINKTGQSPNPEHLKSLANSTPKCGEEQIADDLQQAADFKTAYPSGSFQLALEEAWTEANSKYVSHGYAVANAIANIAIPQELGTRKYEKRMRELFGDDESKWDRTAFSQIWLNEYLAANPFVKREVEELDPANEHEYAVATGVTGQDSETTGFMVINATDIKPEQLTWLWPGRIPQGTVCWFTGKPKTGKSLAILDLIARITTGKDWPDGEKNILPPQDVMLCISEDILSKTVIPRLMAAGADLSHVKFHDRMKLPEGSRNLQLSADARLLKKALDAMPTVSLLILDPLESFSGDVNINSNQEIRPITNAITEICAKTGVTLIGIIHDNKRSDVSAIQKIPGGSAVSAVARAAFGFSRDPENRNEYFMSLVAGSLSKKETGLKYTIGEKVVDGFKAPLIVWGEEHDNTADDLLNAERDKSPSKDGAKLIGLAKDFLPVALKDGPRRAPELIAEAETLGISVGALYRAKEQSKNIMIVKRGESFAEQGRLSWWMLAKEEPVMEENVI
jgi:hypothetical protein